MDPKPKAFMCFYRSTTEHTTRHDADRGDAEAQARLGRLYFEGRAQQTSSTETEDTIVASFTPPLEQDVQQAVKWLTKAALQGHGEAKQLLRTIIAKGDGVH